MANAALSEHLALVIDKQIVIVTRKVPGYDSSKFVEPELIRVPDNDLQSVRGEQPTQFWQGHPAENHAEPGPDLTCFFIKKMALVCFQPQRVKNGNAGCNTAITHEVLRLIGFCQWAVVDRVGRPKQSFGTFGARETDQRRRQHLQVFVRVQFPGDEASHRQNRGEQNDSCDFQYADQGLDLIPAADAATVIRAIYPLISHLANAAVFSTDQQYVGRSVRKNTNGKHARHTVDSRFHLNWV